MLGIQLLSTLSHYHYSVGTNQKRRADSGHHSFTALPKPVIGQITQYLTPANAVKLGLTAKFMGLRFHDMQQLDAQREDILQHCRVPQAIEVLEKRMGLQRDACLNMVGNHALKTEQLISHPFEFSSSVRISALGKNMTELIFIGDGKKLLTINQHGTIKGWRLVEQPLLKEQEWQLIQTIDFNVRNPVLFSEKDSILYYAQGEDTKNFMVWSYQKDSWTSSQLKSTGDSIYTIDYNSLTDQFTSSTVMGLVQVWTRTTEGWRPQDLSLPAQSGYVVNVSPCGTKFFLSNDKDIPELWHYSSQEAKDVKHHSPDQMQHKEWQKIDSLLQPRGKIHSGWFNQQGSMLVMCGSNELIIRYFYSVLDSEDSKVRKDNKINTPSMVHESRLSSDIEAGTEAVFTLVNFSSDGQSVVASTDSGSIYIWSLGDNRKWHLDCTIRLNSENIQALQFSDCGRYLLVEFDLSHEPDSNNVPAVALEKQQEQWQVINKVAGSPQAIIFHPNGLNAYGIAESGYIVRYDRSPHGWPSGFHAFWMKMEAICDEAQEWFWF